MAASALPDMILWMAAHQWQMLTRFAADQDALAPGQRAPDEAARYLRYHHGYDAGEWAQVEAFARDHRPEIEGAEIDARTGRFAEPGYDDGTGFDASTVGQQYRLLFGFASQYSGVADVVTDACQVFLTKWHNLGEDEWDALEAFLEGQEHYRQEGGLSL